MKPGDFVRVKVHNVLGNVDRFTLWEGIVISCVSYPPNTYDVTRNIRLLVSTGELRDLVLLIGDEWEVLSEVG